MTAHVHAPSQRPALEQGAEPREAAGPAARAAIGPRHGNAAAQEGLRRGQDPVTAVMRAARPIVLPGLAAMEEGFGQDLSHVQAYAAPPELLAAVGVRAMALDGKVVFGSPNPEPQVVAHELTHIVQQGNTQQGAGTTSGAATSRPGDASEREADQAATAVLAGETPEVRAAPTGTISGDWLGDAADYLGDRVEDALDSRPDEARLDAEEDLAAFLGQRFSTEHFHPSTGRGNFDAAYDPRAGRLTISLGVNFVFRDGSPSSPDWVAQTAAGAPTFTAEQFAWSEAEKEAFSANTIDAVQTHWSHAYSFHNTRAHWEGLPTVEVAIRVDRAADAATSHYNLEVFKWPDGRVNDAHIDVPGTNHGASHDGHKVGDGTDHDHVGGEFNESAEGGIESPDHSTFTRTTAARAAYAAADTDNPTPILFAANTVDPSAADLARLRTFAATLAAPAMPDFDLTVTGHASTAGPEETNQRLSEDRARTVSNELVSGGVKSQPTARGVGEAGATEDPAWRRVDIVVGAFEATQTTVLHEFGHILGNGDEYPTQDGGSRDVGTPVAHSQLSEDLGITADPVVATHSDGIMSNGEVVNPWNYATFMEVLGTMTATTGQWAIGPAAPRNLGPGDFPTPSGTTGLA